MFEEMKKKGIHLYCTILARHRAKTTYPETLTVNLSDLLASPRPIKVAIVDDRPFPWKDALESRGCRVTYLPDYTKPIKQADQKIKAHDLSSHDIIICDIHGVGSALYPEIDGLGVIEELRRKNPLHVICAYTGNPGAIYSRFKRQDALDMVFSKEWGIDDFLFNFDQVARIFTSPKFRWDFIRRRLVYLGLSEREISGVQRVFVENTLLSEMLNQRFHSDAVDTKRLICNTPSRIDVASLAKFGIKAAELASLVSPFILEAGK